MTPDDRKAPPPTGHSRLATAAALGTILLWCWSGVCFRAGSVAMGAMPYLAVSTVVGVATIVILYKCRGRRARDLFRLPPRVIVAGFFGVAVYTVVMILAIEMADERDLGQVVLINYLWPIWMVLLGIGLLDEKPRVGLLLAGALLGFGGVALVGGVETFTRPPADLLPHAMVLVSAFLWALYSVLLKRWRIPEEKGGSTFHFAACGVLSVLIATIRGDWQNIGAVGASEIFWILFIGIGPIALGYYWWEIGIKRGSLHLIALMAYFIPIGSAVLVGLFFREALTAGLVPGAVLITAGAYLGRRATQSSLPNE